MATFAELKARLDQATAAANTTFGQRLPLHDQKDQEAASRGLLATLPAGGVANAQGRTAWDIAEFDFLDAPCPPTVNPSLWRMGQLNKNAGLFEVTDGVWQARALDYANMTIIRGATGWILVDPLMTRETSAAALKLVNDTLGKRKVSAILVTHTHPDHFGGLKGVVDDNPPIYAPAEFMAYAASEGVLGGNHTSRRAIYQFGITLKPGEEGLIDGGIGKTVAKGTRTFVPPSEFVSETGEERIIDGVRFRFQMASGTEAPAEFTFLLPDLGVLCMAEVCTQTMHNVLTPRGAQVRDALLWSRIIDEAIVLFGAKTDILINCHNWPVWGRDDVRTFMEEQRDIYKYTHDQTLRLANLGHTPNEIAELIAEPEWVSEKFHARGYYGSLKFNAKAVYQFYYGFFDGHPVNIDPLSPTQLGSRFVKAVGGSDAALNLARDAVLEDDLQWAATILNHLVFAEKADREAVQLLAEVYRHQGYRAESGILRNFYLVGAQELEQGGSPLPMAGGRNADLAATLSLKDWFDGFAVRLNPQKAAGIDLTLNIIVDGAELAVSVSRQTEFARIGQCDADASATLTLSQGQLEQLAAGQLALETALSEGAGLDGNAEDVRLWLGLHDEFNLWFNVVTP